MKMIDNKPYREIRCQHCRALICYEYVFAGRIAVDKCPKCGGKSIFTFKHLSTKDNQTTINQEFSIK